MRYDIIDKTTGEIIEGGFFSGAAAETALAEYPNGRIKASKR
jgi:hypothetical protein